MALNKNALIRYKTIDKCLQNRYRLWTLEDLIDACSDALYEFEGKDVNVSKRSIQMDIQLMRSDKLGYNAPIVVYDKKYYKYEDETFSITNIPLTENDMNVLSETVEMLKQFKDFSLFSELDGIIQRLEDKVYTEKTKKSAIIHLEKNEHLRGLEHLDVLYQAILKEVCLSITYRSFKAREASTIDFHPYILKEYNNRWFIVGRENGKTQILTLALDRILSIDYNLKIPYSNNDFDGDNYYKNTIGVTVLNDLQLREVVFQLDRQNAPYVLTKPFHSSQEIMEKHSDGSVTFKINVHLNLELERLIMGFGEAITVIRPRELKVRIRKKHAKALDNYYADKSNERD
jgi:predicted DNA-binding transcriptional regulator YafY